MSLLRIEEAKAKLLSALVRSQKESIPLQEAHGRVLADDLLANADSPPFSNSSMDGFAVRAEDLKGLEKNDSVELRVIGDIPAGHVADKAIKRGESMRIMTGAAIPASANVVIPVEDTDVESREADAILPERIRILRYENGKSFVRQRGEDYRKGQPLVKAGQRLRPQDLALLAMNGQANVSVYRKPRVALLSSGDELVEVGNELPAGKIFESNSFSLAAQIESTGAEVINLGLAPDRLSLIQERLDLAVESEADIIFSSAGVSVGAYDYLREAVQSSGQLDFWRVNMRPGKPLAFGNYAGLPFVGLPGNPVSSFASFEVFGRPALNKMAGVEEWQRMIFGSKLQDSIPPNKRQSFLRARFKREKSEMIVNLTGHQGSGNLYSLVEANCLIVVPANKSTTQSGSFVETWPI